MKLVLVLALVLSGAPKPEPQVEMIAGGQYYHRPGHLQVDSARLGRQRQTVHIERDERSQTGSGAGNDRGVLPRQERVIGELRRRQRRVRQPKHLRRSGSTDGAVQSSCCSYLVSSCLCSCSVTHLKFVPVNYASQLAHFLPSQKKNT